MKTTAIFTWLVMLPVVCLGQMTPHYDIYSTYSVDSNLNISQTVLVEGYTSTPTGSCNTTCCQGMPYPPYYTCWSCPIPGCEGSTHTPKIYNVIGGVGGWSTGPAWSPFAFMSYQTTSTYHATVGEVITANGEADVICSVVGLICDSGFFGKYFEVAETTSKWTGTKFNCKTGNAGHETCSYGLTSWCTPETTPPDWHPDYVDDGWPNQYYDPTFVDGVGVCMRLFPTEPWAGCYGVSGFVNHIPSYPRQTCTKNP